MTAQCKQTDIKQLVRVIAAKLDLKLCISVPLLHFNKVY